MFDPSVTLGPATFSNPVFVASGTYGYGVEVLPLVDVKRLGAVVTKSITLEPREGNPPPRIVETPSGMLNSIGLANVGVKRYVAEMLPRYRELGLPVIMNIAGKSVDDYCRVMEEAEGAGTGLVGYEINVSCPNVESGLEFGVDCGLTRMLTQRLRAVTRRLLVMKLSPNVTDISEIAKAAQEGGADAVSAINTLVGMAVNPHSMRPSIAAVLGGLSGPAIRPVGVAAVYRIARAVTIPVIGIGGITSASDALEYFLAGASAVQVGTANFRDAALGIEISKGVEAFCEERGIERVTDLAKQLRG